MVTLAIFCMEKRHALGSAMTTKTAKNVDVVAAAAAAAASAEAALVEVAEAVALVAVTLRRGAACRRQARPLSGASLADIMRAEFASMATSALSST